MKTFMAKPETVEGKWYLIDAEGVVLGRLSSQVAAILRGKNDPTFTPHVDSGNHVIIINTDKIVLTGKKLDQKFFRRHSGRAGHMHEIQYKTLMIDRSDFVVMRAVKGMLPKNSLGAKMLKHVRIYRGNEHNHEAQQPVEIKLEKR